MSSNYI